MYVSHVADDGRSEPVIDHLREVAELAAEFARPFGAQKWAYSVGMAHDIGKYSQEFQNRILRGGHKVDHSTAGAFELFDKLDAKLLAYCAAGHHGGLPDGGSRFDVNGGPTLRGRMIEAAGGRLSDYGAYSSEVELPAPGSFAFRSAEGQDPFSLSFLTRMVFSCLVDADFLCTERFMAGVAREPLSSESLDVVLKRLEAKVASFYPPGTGLNEARCALLDACAQAAGDAPGVFSLTVPTGGGKTFASLRFALRHALAEGHGMRRVIYGIPYTSIIDQNASVFREVLGERNVLEHHASFDFEDAGEDGEALRLASENWDAPVVVTTNVQLFESLFSNKTSRCRKLHNVAGSVIVLDEAQMIPTKQLEPCIRALAELVHRYNCSVVLCTATQPSLEPLFERFGCLVREIAPDPADMYGKLRRVTYRYEGDLGDDALADMLSEHVQALCVVNSRKQARGLFRLLAARVGVAKEDGAASEHGVFHLTTLMHPVHRERVLEEVRRRLAAGEPCRVVATSLIEAGVDVDFPVAFRALAGVDSIVQCAGRCNREGAHAASESIVHVFRPKDAYRLPADVDQKAALAWSVLGQLGGGATCGSLFDFGALDAISAYFAQLHDVRKGALDAGSVLHDLTAFPIDERVPSIPFKSVADRFRMIEEGSHPVIVPDPAIEEELTLLRNGCPTRGTMRRLSRYAVSLYDNDVRALLASHAVRLLDGDTYELLDRDLYRDATGLDVSNAGGRGLFY